MAKQKTDNGANGTGATYGTNERIYTAEQCAELLSLDVRLIREILKSGALRGYKRHRQWYVLHADVVAYVTGEA